MKLDIDQLKDVAERAVMTYVQAVVGLWLAGTMTDMSLSGMKALAVAAAPGALSVVKSYFAAVLPIGDKSASIVGTTSKPGDLTDDE